MQHAGRILAFTFPCCHPSPPQIDENVQHAGRILAFMSRLCCFRNSWNDPDLEREARHGEEIGR